ncbi:UDP-N-acetylenolpyruvoylglucosamine reductase [Nitrosomonas stercoris]|uniref:UDP-N-acetylenolpyruvoylglucosamine reductase n=1 Tax=Nitrosomonas stercoris TaxID=1444684 RepID=A0A4Y1YK70_9PROT|nr:UDP-N-acetylenolpyruvoylglucosamine reductase [Nitrosomonas stercoris]
MQLGSDNLSLINTDMDITRMQHRAPAIDVSRSRGKLRQHESMARHVSWRAGGQAAYFYQPADLEDLKTFLQLWPQTEPIVMIGLGSNLLVRDGGFPGAIVSLHAKLNDLLLVEQDEYGGVVYAGAGISCAKLARFAASQHLTGAEFLAGIPGTVGGALAMNAGCYGSETWQWVERVQLIDRNGMLHERTPENYHIAYRQVELRAAALSETPDNWFVGGWFRFHAGQQESARQAIKTLLSSRIKAQPLNFPSAGSVFRNPPGDYAARLIEQCGLKGFRIGDAVVSTLHANFINNCGQATATEIETIIDTIQTTVYQKTGINLIKEVRIIGQHAGKNHE